MITIVDALNILTPNAEWTVDFEKNIVLEWLDKIQTQPSEEEIQAKIQELQADFDSKQYQRDRKQEYPTIEELVVALYDEEDKQAIIEKRNAVKAKYPKPE
jgi:hypothetical protein